MQDESIPVTFTLAGKEINGELSAVTGANGLWHIMSNGYYIGQLTNGANGWQFSSQKHGYDQSLSEYFGSIIVSWTDCH